LGRRKGDNKDCGNGVYSAFMGERGKIASRNSAYYGIVISNGKKIPAWRIGTGKPDPIQDQRDIRYREITFRSLTVGLLEDICQLRK
jgi:hypothetical protein